MTTLWQDFRTRWKDRCGSSLYPDAYRICLARGQLACDILSIKEAPSIGADVIGQPFVSEFGLIVDDIIKRAAVPDSVRLAYSNLVGCIPRSEEDRSTVPHIVHPAPILRKMTYHGYQVRVATGRLAQTVAEHIIEAPTET